MYSRVVVRPSVSWKGRHFVLGATSIAYYVKQGDGESRGEIQERNEGAALGQHRHLRGPEEQAEETPTHCDAHEGD